MLDRCVLSEQNFAFHTAMKAHEYLSSLGVREGWANSFENKQLQWPWYWWYFWGRQYCIALLGERGFWYELRSQNAISEVK